VWDAPQIALTKRRAGHRGDNLRGVGSIWTKTAGRFRTRAVLDWVVSRDNPGTSDGIFAQFHVSAKHWGRSCVNYDFDIVEWWHTKTRMTLCYNPRQARSPIEIMTEPSTPLMRQYAAVKKEHPTALLFFRLGDFYELFFEDAIVASKELQITLTSRNKEKGIAVPMCGVPHHAAEGYIGKLIRKGFKVAICEQMEDPRLAKKQIGTKLVRREVTRVVTPGTAADSLLGSEENNFLAALAQVGDRVGFAALDLSTGEFRATEFSGDGALRRVQEELEQLRPKELLYGSAAPLFDAHIYQEKINREKISRGQSPQPRASGATCTETPLDDWIFAPDHAIPLLENHFGVLSLEGFGLAGRTRRAAAAGAILYYVRSTQRGSFDHVDRIGWYERQNCLVLDAVTVRNLELIEPLFAGTDAG
jgi:DNA mismatch repair protein MutS